MLLLLLLSHQFLLVHSHQVPFPGVPLGKKDQHQQQDQHQQPPPPPLPPQLWLRLSAAAYNHMEEFEVLRDVILELSRLRHTS
jgi:hypothetical protein